MTLSVAAVLAESAGRRPDHPAMILDTEVVTYRELWGRARRYAAVLAAHGVGPGDTVAILVPNSLEFPAVLFGVLTLGAAAVPVDALLRADEIAYVLGDSRAAAVVCAAPLLGEGSAGAAAAGVPVLTVGEPGPSPYPRLDARAADAEPVPGLTPREPGDLALVLYTSGTTGLPKGAMLTHLNIVMNTTVTLRSPFAYQSDDVLLACLPLFHTFGLVCGMLTCFQAGATAVLMRRFDGPAALALMAARGCTVFMGVPTMYMALLDAAAAGGARPPRLDRAFAGGAALPVAVLRRFRDTFGCEIYEGYGLTEASPVVAYNQPGRPTRPGTVGTPIWGVRTEIARPGVTDRIELLPPGEVGEVVISGHNVMLGYLGRPAATAEALVDGWLRSGDLGVKDRDGYLTIVDRKKDMVLRGGHNVYPREVEEILLRHPDIDRVAVVGLPDERLGEEVCAVVVARAGAVAGPGLAAGIVRWSRERMAAYKYPRRVEFAGSLPLGPSGKVLKRELVAGLTGSEGQQAELDGADDRQGAVG